MDWGVSSHFERQLIVPTDKSVCAMGRWHLPHGHQITHAYFIQALESLGKQFNFSLDLPFNDLDEDIQSIILYGSGNVPVTMEFDDGMRSYRTKKPFEGVIPNLARRLSGNQLIVDPRRFEKYRANQACDICGGKRLKAEALAVKIDNCDISDVTRLIDC